IQPRYFQRKRFWAGVVFSYYLLYSLLWLLICSWASIDRQHAVLLFIVIFGMAQMAIQLGSSVWLAWMGDLVPPRESNSFWNRRGGLMQVSLVAASVTAGFVVDYLGRNQLDTYGWVFAAGIIFGFMSFGVQADVPDPFQAETPSTQSVLTKLRISWRNERFRQLLVFFGFQSASVWLIAPFIFVYLQETLNFDMKTIQLLVALSSSVSFLSAYVFQVIGRKYGRKPIVLVCTFLKGIEFICWGVLLPGCGWRMALPAFIVGGFVNMGLTNCTLSLITSVEKRKNQSFSIAIFFAVTGLLGFASASVSGVILNWLGTLDFLNGNTLSPFNFLALVVAAAYFISVLLFVKYKEDGAVSAVRVVKTLLANNPFRAIYHAHVLSRPMDEKSRIEALANAEGNLIVSELLSDLYNPSSRVRESAVWNIARMGRKADPVLEDELIKIVDMPELGVQGQAMRGLGHLHSVKALPVLLKYLRAGNVAPVQDCIFALGIIGGSQVVEALDALLSVERYRPLWPQIAEALGKIGNFRHVRKIYHVLGVEFNWVLKKQMLIAIGKCLLVVNKKKIYSAFEKEDKTPGIALEDLFRRVQVDLTKHVSVNDIILLTEARDKSDEENFSNALEKAMLLLLKCGGLPTGFTLEVSSENIEKCFGELFGSNGEIRHPSLLKDELLSVAWWLLLHFWAEIKYSSSDFDRYVFLAAMQTVETVIEHKNTNIQQN
ncbi:MAG: MFS transporter, partial [Victivallaceae bacterium]